MGNRPSRLRVRQARSKNAPGKVTCGKFVMSMEFGPIILHTAHRNGGTDAATPHALRLRVRHYVQDDSMTMFIKPDETGNLVGVEVVEWHGVTATAHAMRPARSNYLK